jgi:putative flippase GtrA
MLAALVGLGVDKGIANAFALIVLAQLHFFASREITWAERWVPARDARWLFGRLARFDGMMATSMLANQITFEVAAPHVPLLVAGALGIGVASLINFAVSDRLIFRASKAG